MSLPRILLAVLLVAACGLTLGSASPAGGARGRSAPDDGAILLFVGGPGSVNAESGFRESGLYAIDSHGRRLKELVPDGVLDARWSPDGRRIAFTRSRPFSDGGPELYVVDARRGSPRLVARASRFEWSPDGRRLAYLANVDATTRMYAVSTNGHGRRLLTAEAGWHFTWSPDGSKIAYVRGERLLVMNADGSGRRRLAPSLRAHGYLSWSPDGSRLAFYPCCREGVAIVDADGRRLRRPVREGVLLPSWSPDGRWIGLSGDVPSDNGERSGTFLVRPDGSGFRQLSTLGGSIHRMAWSPDASAYVIEGRCCSSADVWLVTLAGAERRLTSGWRYGYSAHGPQWSPRPVSTAELRGRYVPSSNPTDSIVADRIVRTTRPVEDLVADGDTAVFGTASACESWKPATGAHVPFRFACSGRSVGGPTGRTGVGFAGRRFASAAYGSAMGGDNWFISTGTLDVPATKSVTYPGGGTNFRTTPIAGPLGDRDLLVFSTWGPCRISQDPPCAREPKQNGVLHQIVGSTAVVVGTSDGPLTPLAVDAGRVLVDHEDGQLELLGKDGSSLRTFALNAAIVRDVRMQGRDLVVLTTSAVEVTDAESGAFLRRWPLPIVEGRLVDVQDGMAVIVSGTEIHLLRLADGRTAVLEVSGSGPVLAQLEPSGLFYSYTVQGADRYRGRVVFMPFDALPIR